MKRYKTAAMLALIEQSPAAVAAHDKSAWLALFARQFMVEDPVGSQAVTATPADTLARFYETFIAANQIRFAVARDYCGPCTVVRDLDIHITMAPGVAPSVPMHLVYEIDEEHDQLRIKRLAAHWELAPMMLQLLRMGLPALPVMWRMSLRMYQQLGIKGMLGFARAALTRRGRLYHLLEQLVTALNCQDHAALNRCLVANGKISDNNGATVPLAALKGLRVTKKIAAGHWISASLTLPSGNALLLAETDAAHRQLLRCSVFFDTTAV